MTKIDCTKCRFRKVCKIAGDPWDMKHGGKEENWCPDLQEIVDGKETGREIAISDLGLSQSGETNLMSKKMTWEHPIKQARMNAAEKIRLLVKRGYSNQEIAETLSMGDKANYIRKVRSEM